MSPIYYFFSPNRDINIDINVDIDLCERDEKEMLNSRTLKKFWGKWILGLLFLPARRMLFNKFIGWMWKIISYHIDNIAFGEIKIFFYEVILYHSHLFLQKRTIIKMLLWHENYSHKLLCVYIGRWSEVIEYKKYTVINNLLSSTYWCFSYVLGSWGFLFFLSGMPRSSVSHHFLPQWHRQPCLMQISTRAYCPAFRSSLLWGIWGAGVPSSQESVFITWVRNRLEKVK